MAEIVQSRLVGARRSSCVIRLLLDFDDDHSRLDPDISYAAALRRQLVVQLLLDRATQI